MKNIQLKHATLCQLLLYLPAFALIIAGAAALFLNSAVGVILFLLCLIAGLAYLVLLFPLLLGSDYFFSNIRHWKKDRLWYTTTCNGTGAEAVTEAIIRRVRKHGTSRDDLRTTAIRPLCVQYRSHYSPTVFWSSIERILMLYKVDHLDETTYRSLLSSAGHIAAQLKPQDSKLSFLQTKEEKEAPVCRAVALIIIANSMDSGVAELVRKLPHFEETAVVPCVVDLYANRYCVDGMKEAYISGMTGKPVKNMAIDLIKKAVFNGHLPLQDNPHYDYTRIDRADLERSLSAYVKEYFESSKEEKRISGRLAKSMGDGDIVQKENTLYIKRGERVAVFLIDDTENGALEILTDEYWSYPKHHRIAKATLADLRSQTQEYFAQSGKQVHFFDEEQG